MIESVGRFRSVVCIVVLLSGTASVLGWVALGTSQWVVGPGTAPLELTDLPIDKDKPVYFEVGLFSMHWQYEFGITEQSGSLAYSSCRPKRGCVLVGNSSLAAFSLFIVGTVLSFFLVCIALCCGGTEPTPMAKALAYLSAIDFAFMLAGLLAWSLGALPVFHNGTWIQDDFSYSFYLATASTVIIGVVAMLSTVTYVRRRRDVVSLALSPKKLDSVITNQSFASSTSSLPNRCFSPKSLTSSGA